MATSALRLLLIILTCVLIITPAAALGSPTRRLLAQSACNSSKPFSPVLGFGDSTSDTGNAVRSAPIFAAASSPPYGKTFFRKATGRFSDGRLMVDFLAAALNVPFLPPHRARSSSSASENFAVAGATSLDITTLHNIANVTSFTSDSLGVQLGWFKADTAHADLSNALVYFGEIGGNDYNYAFALQRPPQVISALISSVMGEIATALDQILSSGVKKVVVQGQFPMGCISLYLKVLNNTKHDKHGCVESAMQVSNQHNTLLREVVKNATAKYPNAKIVFFDTSAAYVHILDNAAKYNFTNVKDPCYTGDLAILLSTPPPPVLANTARPAPLPPANATTCPNPQNYVGWDGIHLTDAMYGAMMKLFLTDSHFSSPFPNFLTSAIACTH